MAYVPNSGSVVAFQSDPTKLVGTVSIIGAPSPASVFVLNPVSTLGVTLSGNPSISGQVGASVVGHAPVVVVGGSITTVGGTTGNSSVQVLNFPANQSVSGRVQSEQVGTRITSLVSTIPSSVIVGASIFGLPPVNVVNTNLNIGGSVIAFQGAGWSGSIAAQQIGTRITSIINVIPSSVLVGASIFGQLPAGTAPLGSVATLQGTNPWVIVGSVYGSGSIVAFQGGTQVASAISYVVRNDAVASALGADLTYRVQAADSAGRALFKPFAAEEVRIEGYHSVVSTSQTTLVAAPGAGLRNYITDFFIANTGATTTLITFKDSAGSILGYTIAPNGGGSNAPGLATPIRTGVNATFDFQPTSASSIIYATVKGYKAP